MTDGPPQTQAAAGSGGARTVSAADTEQVLRTALEHRDVLLHELDHRVKNNLQLIASLMMLQIRRAEDAAVREALEGMLERLNAISIVHRRLFQSDDPGRVDAAQFIRDLAEELTAVHHLAQVEVTLDLTPIDVGLAKAAPLALLLNELVSNALRHAFPDGRAGRLAIKIVKNDSFCRIGIRDDGVGMDETTNRREGFGRTIVDLLSRQLDAQVIWTDARPGVAVEVVLPVNGDE